MDHGKIYPLDGDIYYDDFKVIGFEEFQNIPMGVNTGIDILVYWETVDISEFIRKIKQFIGDKIKYEESENK